MEASKSVEILDIQCYRAVNGYIQFLYHEMGWRNIAGLLGSIWSEEGHDPLDLAIWLDWKDYVSDMKTKNVPMHAVSEDLGWRCMVLFLDHVFQAGEEDLLVAIDGMQLTDDVPEDKGYVGLWNICYQSAAEKAAPGAHTDV